MKTRIQQFAFLFAVILLAFNPQKTFAEITEVSDTIRLNTTWSDTVKVTGDILVADSATLTIQPGTFVEIQGYFGIDVNGTLDAQGTEFDTIIFTVHDTIGWHNFADSNGAWKGIFISNTDVQDTSKISWARIDHCKNFKIDKQWFQSGALAFETHLDRKLLLNKVIIEYNYAEEKGAGFCGSVYNDAFLQMDSCIFRYNISGGSGGGMWLYGSANMIVKDCLFEYNQAISAGGIYLNLRNARISGNVLRYNYASGKGGGAYLTSKEVMKFSGNTLYENEADYGGGLYLSGVADDLKVESNRIFNNRAYEGGGAYLDATNSILANNIIVNDSASRGGGIYCNTMPSPKFYHNTICNNLTEGDGGGIYLAESNPEFINNIIHGNSSLKGNQVYLLSNQYNPKFINCLIEEGMAGFKYSGDSVFNGTFEDNIDEWPMFTDPSPSAGIHANALDMDWTLEQTSPCINTGPADLEDYYIPEKDINGKDRIANQRIDIGATENHISKMMLSGVIPKTVFLAADTILVTSTITIPDTVLLTFGAGSRVLFRPGCLVDVYGNLRAIGTAKDSIYFEAADSVYINDGYLYGAWRGFFFRNSMIAPPIDDRDTIKSRMAYCVIRHSRTNAIKMERYLDLMVEHSSISHQSLNVTQSAIKCTFSGFYLINSIMKNCSSQKGWTLINSNESKIHIEGSEFAQNSIIDSTSIAIGNFGYCLYTDLTVRNSSFHNNHSRGGPLFYTAQSNLVFERNSFFNNNLCSGMIHAINGTLKFSNNLVANNTIKRSKRSPSVLILKGHELILANNTIVHNDSVGLDLENVQALLENNIIYGQRGMAIMISGDADKNEISLYNNLFDTVGIMSHILSGEVVTFENHLDTLPIFVQPSLGIGSEYPLSETDWSLMDWSPCINTGNPETTAGYQAGLDLPGNARVNGYAIDLGAFEHQGSMPEIVSNPAGGTRCAGSNMVLSIESSDTARFQWQKDGMDIEGATGSKLKIDTVTLDHRGNYTCILSNLYGSVTSTPVTLFVDELPVFLEEPETKWAAEGSETVLNTYPVGSSPTIKWQKDGVDIEGITPQLKILNTDLDDEGLYRAIVSNNCGADTSTTAALYIAPQLCMVTVSPTTGHNLVIWEKKSQSPVMAYNLYRESEAAGIYDLLTTQPYDELSVFVDTTADPTVQAYLYKVTAIDTAGNVTDIDLCEPHKTIHLLVTTNPELNTTQLAWDRYFGFDYQTYTVYRSSTGLNFDPVHSMSSSLNSWTDPDPSTGDLFYRIAVEKPDPCIPEGSGKKAGTGPYQHALSNMDDNKLKLEQMPPDTIILSNNSIQERKIPGTMVGKLSTIDNDSLESHTYKFVPGDGDDDNNSFTLMGDLLISSESFDYEVKNRYTVRIRSTDESGNYCEVQFIINIDETTYLPLLNASMVNVFPNPFNQSTTITFPNQSKEPYRIVLSDLSGKVCRIVDGITSSEYELERGELRNGLYFLELRGPKNYRGKIIIE